jgi:hypothetical protein
MRIVKRILVSGSDEGDAKAERDARGWTRDAWTTLPMLLGYEQ